MTFRSSVGALALMVVGAFAVPAIVPAVVHGQGASRVHVVRAGETLWRIATNELGDGHRWRELVRLNPRIRSERSLRVGTRLVLPRRRGRTAGRPVPLPTAANPVPRIGEAPPTPAPAAAKAPPSGGEVVPTAVAADAQSAPTIFSPASRSRSLGGARLEARSAEPFARARQPGSPESAVSGGGGFRSAASMGADAIARESLVSPWFDETGVVGGGGRVLRRVDPPAMGRTIDHRTLHLFDRVQLRAPSGAAPVEMAAFLAVDVGDVVAGFGRLVTPVGIVHLTRSPDGVAPAEGVVTAVFGTLEEGVVLVALGPAVASGDGGGMSSEPGEPVEGQVVAIVGGATLPTLQHMVMLDVGASRGVRTGDVVSFLTDDDGVGRSSSGQEIARGVVLRVTARSASALVTSQSQPVLRAGGRVRIVRALP